MLKNNNYKSIFHIWLITLLILVGLIIAVGGLTRLTDSGLSITKWELFKGIFPPTSPAEWLRYFESYKKIPQYLLLNSGMTLAEFKIIFLWEYAHRLIARVIGIIFLLPFLFFLFSNILKKDIAIQLNYILILILIQGSVGWFMVKSGLVDNTSVSHYRLSIHLIIAFSILAALFWILLNSLNRERKKFFQLNNNTTPFKFLLALLFLQIILGAFVSGLDGGKIYQTWPLMDGNYFPDDAMFSNLFDFDKPSIAQFFHRNIAYLIFFLTVYIGYSILKKKEIKLYSIFLFYLMFVLVQITLGILVLVSGSNIYFASMHQISSIFLIVIAVNLYYHSIRS
jgi:cytochrome c oxidase assembly protein subunit 15